MDILMTMNRTNPLLLLLFSIGPAFALPEGTEVLQGGATHNIAGKEMTIQAPDGSIIRHQRFNLSSDETVRFRQPTAKSRVLNRITDSSPSQINGRIEANGQVYLVNPAGVVFGSQASVEAGRLHVVGGGYSDQDFKARTDRFTSLSGEVRNEGELRAGSVGLSGSSVVNRGRILAPEGYVALSAGSSVELSEIDDSLSVSLDAGSQNLVTNESVVGDLAGQALLGTGVLEGREVHLGGSELEASGSIQAEQARIRVGGQLRQTGTDARLDADLLEIEPLSSGSYNRPSVSLPSSANRLSTLRAGGAYSSLSASSGSSFALENASSSSSSSSSSESTLQVDQLDLRSYEGDLTLRDPVGPDPSSIDTTLLVGAKGKVIFESPSASYPYLRRVAYGQTLVETPQSDSYSSDSSTSTEPESAFQTLEANRVDMSQLSASLPPELVLALAEDNPEFAELQASENLELEGLSDAQLSVLLQYGYLSGYSYFLKSRRISPLDLYGGDFTIFAKPESDPDAESDAEEKSVSGVKNPSEFQRLAATITFSGVTTPVLSPAASVILDRALDDQVEDNLRQYLKP
jgi:filamentous hemagglutinin family protein